MTVALRLLGCLLSLQVLAGTALAQERLALARLDGPVTLDGFSQESAWQGLAPLPMTMYQPTYQGTMTERTEIRVGYDATALYFAGRFYDADPNGVLASSLSRDSGSAADDYFNIAIDPFDDNENVRWFWTNPVGVRGDAALSNDGEGNNAMNESWDTFWDVATARTDDGWFVEVRIPFSSLGFQARGETVTMGLAVSRVISRKNERHVFPAIPPNWQFGFVKPSQAQDVTLTGVRSRRPLYVTPYLLGGTARATAFDAAAPRFYHEDDLTHEAGLDLRYNLTGTLTLDATLNTDFAQVEADDQQVNLTRFSLFFPEKRPFFQERSALFNFALGQRDRLFHSRQIGLSGGVPVRLLGGARLVGRVGAWDLGVMNMQTDASALLPAENFGVMRLRRTVLNAHSYVGGLATSRLGFAGQYNVAYGVDALLRVVGDEYLTLKWAQSADDAVAFDAAAASYVRLDWRRRRRQGLNYTAAFTRWGRTFAPETGFFTRTAFTQGLGVLAYDHFVGATSPLRRWRAVGYSSLFWRNADGSLETGEGGAEAEFELKSGATLAVEGTLSHEDLQQPLAFTEAAVVPVGGYTFVGLETALQTASGRRVRANFAADYGAFYDGTRLDLGVAPTWNVSQHLELEAAYRLNRVRFPRRPGFDAHLAQLRAAFALNTKLSTSAFLQFNSLADRVALNLRFRYNFGERHDLWVVYNEGLNTDRDDPLARRPRTDQRTVLVKYTHTFAL